ncbi:plastid DNA replication [Trichomonas vaginalis G3]|uniref:plastid DNA replication n=1 Tax=Trichomonas vaginalis (strain ATCC PRA-98 / G3) TaxID=412133 RepID=UPI0021E52DD4|nr:plastid DNA replication [Trichomonas vaginalis G3]KAI5537241.1 plastid DNA replication [Trichomonas vaginalis G3]
MFEPVRFRAPRDMMIPQIRNPEADALGIIHGKKRSNSKKKKKIIKQSTIDQPDMLDMDQTMTDLSIPPFLQHAYVNGLPPPKIVKLRQWQRDLISSPEWKCGKNGIILVPTSGGKTVAADIAIAQMLERDPDGKALYALPFVSLASEKTTEFKARFFKHSVRPFYQNIGGADFRRGSIAVCTFEKAHALLNSALRDGYFKKFKLIVIDEIHMINEEQRGAVIESLIEKCLLLREKHNIRIIGLTATLNESDVDKIATWIGGFKFICESRPSRIKHYFKSTNGTLYVADNGEAKKISTMKSLNDDKKHILSVIRSVLRNKKNSTVLVFVNNRKQTVSVAEYIASHIYDENPNLPSVVLPDEYLLSDRKQLIQKLSKTDTGLDESLARCVMNGVGFHHAGMLLEERKIVEEAAKNCTISVIVATTTLSAGINIRSVTRVVIYEAYRYIHGIGQRLIPNSLYTQMAGRAGRDESIGGDVVVLGMNDKESELTDFSQLCSQRLEDINPHLLENDLFDRFLLQCFSTGLLKAGLEGAIEFIKNSFEALSNKNLDFENIAKNSLERLRNRSLLDKDYKVTPVGRAIAESAMSIEEGIELQGIIKNVETGLSLEDDVHMLYLCIPPSAIANERTPDYDSDVWENIISKHETVTKLVSGISIINFQKHFIETKHLGGKNKDEKHKKIDHELDRFYFACLLGEMIDERPLSEVTRRFSISRGAAQSLQMTCANFAGQTAKFCEKVGCPLLGTALNAFRKRLDFGVQSDILPLLRLPSCTKSTARKLIQKGISSPSEVAEASTERLATIISNGKTVEDSDITKAKRLKDEAAQVAKSLAFLDTLEDFAVQNTLVQEAGIEVL